MEFIRVNLSLFSKYFHSLQRRLICCTQQGNGLIITQKVQATFQGCVSDFFLGRDQYPVALYSKDTSRIGMNLLIYSFRPDAFLFISPMSACTANLYICQHLRQKDKSLHIPCISSKKIKSGGKPLEAFLFHIKETDRVIQQQEAKVLFCNNEAGLGSAVSLSLLSFYYVLS